MKLMSIALCMCTHLGTLINNAIISNNTTMFLDTFHFFLRTVYSVRDKLYIL